MKTNTEIIFSNLFFENQYNYLTTTISFNKPGVTIFVVLNNYDCGTHGNNFNFFFDIMLSKFAKPNQIVDGLYKIHHIIYRI